MPELNPAERKAVEKLMPFYVTGTLDQEDRGRSIRRIVSASKWPSRLRRVCKLN
ncbi:MAG: hypothetical protein JRH01_26170 [Deltaproteobacteria bacterium]|nr:hypothetical protein [Deltaproteobacteria bacterium]